MTQVIRETNTCPRHGHPARLLLWGQSHVEEQYVQRLGQQSQRARAPTQTAPSAWTLGHQLLPNRDVTSLPGRPHQTGSKRATRKSLTS